MTAEEDSSFVPWSRRPIPPEEGELEIELSRKPVPYHIARCFEGQVDSVQCRALALSSCRISCMATDVVRGRISADRLQRSVTTQCLRKLDTMAVLLDDERRRRPEQGHPMGVLPVIPQSVNGMLISATHIETAIHLTIGSNDHWANIALQQIGCRWMCVYADIG
ncbi:hypothetical protein [Bifidobacterium samirii]|uniref:Uncharacterized protein n=1 Tax=Bifidobacterium samirii TaxID=2306974 RepID=A0A430FNP8_9BIFI|nr:hypothetical protein [Bifidobacterium samirii]RSX54463.1 hypothetical protein D2E24_1584 [Bifidobacterium samirii]